MRAPFKGYPGGTLDPFLGRRPGALDEGLASGVFEFSSHPLSPFNLPSSRSTPNLDFPGKILYLLANLMLNSFMFSSLNAQISSSIRPIPALSRTSSISFTSFTSSFFAQTLPIFSTPTSHRTHSNARKPFPLMGVLHKSLDTPGGTPPPDTQVLSTFSTPSFTLSVVKGPLAPIPFERKSSC